MSNSTVEWGRLGRSGLARYLYRWYGWRPADQLIETTGAGEVEQLRIWAAALDVPELHNRPGVMSGAGLAEKLGVSKRSLRRWSGDGLLPFRTGYQCNRPVRVYERPCIENWLMDPKPAWKLIHLADVTDKRMYRIMSNCMELQTDRWICTQEAADAHHIHPETIRYHAQRGRIEAFFARGKRYVYQPDVRRLFDDAVGVGAGV